MEQQFDSEVLLKLKQKKHKRIWKRILSIMMCLVVFCTTYILILPAITKENHTFCGIDEHTHNEKCYEDVLLCQTHVHSEECYESHSNLICTESTDDGHTHGETCSPVTEITLICGTEEHPGHTHTDSCAPVTETILSCGLAESEGHTHTESCSSTETVLSCHLEESEAHTHSGDCYTTVTSIVCGIEESSGHIHDDGCYITTTTYGCGVEETTGHIHDDSCYTTTTTYGCGMEEVPPSHIHTETCYAEPQQICTIETDPDHQHTDDCYGQELICGQEEHTHTKPCFADLSADLESESTWKSTLPQLTGVYTQDVIEIARSQLGYTESTRNYIVDENDNIHGYTRYGAWYGSPYGEWCAMFVSFCMHYAGVEEMPQDASCSNWVNVLSEQDLYKIPSEYVPKVGDIIFFDWEGDGSADHVGLVDEVVDTNVVTIEGNSGKCVVRNEYELHDNRISGYGILSEIQPQLIEESTHIDPEDTDAWASLVEPDSLMAETPHTEKQSAPEDNSVMAPRFAAASPYSSRRMRTTNQNLARTGTPLNLKPYINAVTMYDADGKPIPNGSVVSEGDLIKFQIDYTITGQQLGFMDGESITVTSDTLIYEIPKTFKMIHSNTGDIVNSAGVPVGTFVIDSTSGTITLCFSEGYVEQNAKGIQIQGDVSFFSTVTKITDSDSENQKFEFKDGITLGVIIEEKIEAVGDLKIEKRKVSVDGEEILYEVKVTSAEGTSGPVTITDRMSEGLTFKEGIEVLKGDGTPVNNASFNTAADNNSFTMTLPEMAAGDSYIIRYRCTADIDLLGADMTVRNTVSVAGNDSQGNELKDKITVDHTFEVLKKTGVTNDDGTITWTITVNRDKADISGWVLEDIVTTNAGVTPYTGPVTIRDSSGNILFENITLPITFPEGSKDTYVITYTTSHNLGDGDMIYNKAILKDKDTQVTVVTGTGMGSPIQKSGVAGTPDQDENGNYRLPITWTVTVDTTIGEIPAGECFNDKMGSDSANDVYMTYNQLIAVINSIDEALQPVGSYVSGFKATVFSPGAGQGATYTLDDLRNNVDNCQSFLYEHFAISLGQDVPKGHVLTFTYETYGVFENNVVKNAVFNNKFNISGNYEINGQVTFTAGTIEATKFALKPYDPNGGTLGQLDWNGMETTNKIYYENLHDSYLAWAIQLNIPANYTANGDVVIYEDLPEGVSVKGLDLPFTGKVPTSNLQMRNMVPGQTYTWDFKVYPLDQYDIYYEPHRQGGEDISIVVKVTNDGDLEITVPGIVFELMGGYAAKSNLEQAQTYLYIYTQIDEDFAWTPKAEGAFIYVNAFENRFTIKNEDGDVIDIGSQTQEVTKDESKGIIRKDATTDNNNIITYSVVLNAYKKDLIENSGTLKIHDELEYTSTAAEPLRLRLVPGSVKLYEVKVNNDGSYTKLGEVTVNYSYEENSSVQYGITTWVHTIDLNIPDGKSLLLEYSYKASGTKNIRHNILNVCSIEGVGEGSIDGDHNVEIDVKDATAQANTKGVMIYKVDAGSDGIFLKEARFNIYIWNEEQNAYIIVHHPDNGSTDFVTDYNGMIVLDNSTMGEDQFAYNTAYYIVEVESPNGYYLSPEPYYFYIVNEDTVAYPSCIPEGFVGHALVSGDIIYRQNVSETTEISVEKYWMGYNGDYITVTGEQVPSVTLELWQMVQGDPTSAKVYGTYTMTPDEDGNWSLTITDLPKATKNTNDTKGTNYLYYIKEVSVGGFALESSENNVGINSGTIKLVNRELEGYDLPKTGGTGTQLYTVAGLLLMLSSAAYLLYIHRKRRREDFTSS